MHVVSVVFCIYGPQNVKSHRSCSPQNIAFPTSVTIATEYRDDCHGISRWLARNIVTVATDYKEQEIGETETNSSKGQKGQSD